jgi:glycosyltransferase involved in cell wall biosynthesis
MEKRIWYTKSGNVDRIQHEDNGLLVPLKDAEALAEGVKRLLKNPDERLRMGARGRERAEKEFNQEIIIQQTLDVYREIIITERLVAGKG